MSLTHTPQERAVMLLGMRRTADAFYQQAVVIGNHPFIEFSGLLNEYIKLCEWAHADGIDFTQRNMREKLDCIFSGRLAGK